MSNVTYYKQAVLNWGPLKQDDFMNTAALEKKYPVIVTMRDGTWLLGSIVTADLEVWLAKNKDVYRVDVQVGTRYALRDEETDLQ